ncbi:MAG: hypothetical protein WCR04_05285 [Fibrobacteraceae bacterium]
MRYPFLLIFVFAFLLLPQVFAADGAVSSKKLVDGGIPLPRETSYQERGAGVGLAVGGLFPSGEKCKNLFQWQGTGEFYYWPNISAGADIRMYGGNIDKEYAMIFQRYHVYGRYHVLMSPNWSVYVNPSFGFESTDLSKIRDDSNDNSFGLDEESQSEITGCDDEYSLDGFSTGMEIGSGWVFLPDWGTFSALGLDYSSAGVGQLSFYLGLSFNIRNHWNYLKEDFLGSWISLEFIAHHYFTDEKTSWGEAILLAFVLNI